MRPWKRTRYVSYLFCMVELTIAQARESEDLMSVDGLDPENSDLETESGSANDDDEQGWGGTRGGGEADQSPSSGKPVKVPAGHELREMKEASELYKSSAFKLQVRILCGPSAETSRLTLTYGIDRLVDTRRSPEIRTSRSRIFPSNTPRNRLINSNSISPTPANCISFPAQSRRSRPVFHAPAYRGN